MNATRTRAAWALLLALVAGCGAPSSSPAPAELRTLSSWGAAAAMLADAWARRAVPTPYARRSLATARDEVARLTRALRARPAAAPAGLIGEVDRLGHALAGLGRVVETGDRIAVEPGLRELRRAGDALARTAGGELAR